MKRITTLAALALLGFTAMAQGRIEDNFLEPPRDCHPRVWWHWMNGNISKDGIKKDLEWMDRAGIAGFHNFDAGLETPQIVDHRITYMTPEWKECFNYAIDLADSLGMEVTIASSPGWSETGGPWVSQEDAMKKIVWNTTVIDGSRRFRGALPAGSTMFGDYPGKRRVTNEKAPCEENWYRDIAVIAVKMNDADRTMDEMGAKVSTSNGIDGAFLHDGDLNTWHPVTPDAGGHAWICYEFPEPTTVKAWFQSFNESTDGHRYARTLECSDDGVHFKTIFRSLPDCVDPVKYGDIETTTARFFRYRNRVKGEAMNLSEFTLSGVTLVNNGVEMAGFYTSGSMRDFYPTVDTGDGVKASDVIDVTKYFRRGVLNWKAPSEGRWRIYRFGYNLTGKVNSPASPEATGLEVDKFNPEAVRRYYKEYIKMYNDATGGRMGSSISHIMIDSYEARTQTWTARMPQEFKARRGYDLIKWLPALTGLIIDDADQTLRFLADWRQTLGELMSEYHYDIVSDILKPYGMKRYTESHEGRRAFVGDGMDPKHLADIPMAAFWTNGNSYSSYPMAEADIREAASVAHIYGQNIAAAESFTCRGTKENAPRRAWTCHPGNIKRNADAAMAEGLNLFVIHCSTHQPSDAHVPGLALGKYGQWFTRFETWSEEAKAWTDYLARSCYMLRQGRYSADIAYYYSETSNLTSRFKESRPEIPEGFAFDYVNRSVLLDVLKLDGNRLTTASGMSYRALILDNECFYMSIPVLRRIKEFADAGVIIAGAEPLNHCDLMGSDAEFKALVKDIWHSGRGNVVPLTSCGEALEAAGVTKDVEIVNCNSSDIRFVHRKLQNGELYWIANICPSYNEVDVNFRVSGKKPKLLHADTGLIEDVSYRMAGGRTHIHLDMVPDDAVFILFTKDTDAGELELPRRYVSMVQSIGGAWDVEFLNRDGSTLKKAGFGKLQGFEKSADPDIRYFSGTAVYSKTFEFYGNGSGQYILDLGKVFNMAHVYLNGVDLGLAWKVPYRLDVSEALMDGDNRLEVRVINSWVNRLIGDEQPGAARSTYIAYRQYWPEDELLPSGLLGPVRIVAVR